MTRKTRHKILHLVLAAFLFFVFLPTKSFAQEDIPGSYHIEYGGLYKVAYDSVSRFLRARWLDQEELQYSVGNSAYIDFIKNRRRIDDFLTEWEHGTPWYYRRWWHSLQEKNGGALKNPTKIYIGKTRTLIDLGIIYLTNTGEVKWRGLEIAIDFEEESSITLGVGKELNKPTSGWKFKFYPNMAISTFKLFNKPTETIRRVDIYIGGQHTIRRVDMTSFLLSISYDIEKNGWFFGFQLKLLQW